MRPRIFGIGLNKTGTISLHEALTTLGYRSLHWGGPEVRRVVEQALAEGRPLVDDFPDHDAFSDIWCLSEHFALLDEQYPGSRFILTTRDLDAWLTSRERHVARNRQRRDEGTYTGTFLEVDREAWTAEYRSHHRAVAAYFAGRDDLLVMDITRGDGYEVLCPFLGHEVRPEPFPARHRATNPPPSG